VVKAGLAQDNVCYSEENYTKQACSDAKNRLFDCKKAIFWKKAFLE
jgi:hypothetical protein